MTDKATSIEAYILQQDQSIQELLRQVDQVISQVLPKATRGIKWGMPSYWEDHNVMHFAAYKQHFSLFPGSQAIEHFAEELANYKTTKGAIQFPYSQPVNYDLIQAVTQWCYETGNHH